MRIVKATALKLTQTVFTFTNSRIPKGELASVAAPGAISVRARGFGALRHCRVKEQYERREAARVEIVDFRPEHADAFRRMNLNWINHYWEVEEADCLCLDHPQEKILDPGGAILMAMHDGEAVSTVALIPMGSGSYEEADPSSSVLQGLRLEPKLRLDACPRSPPAVSSSPRFR